MSFIKIRTVCEDFVSGCDSRRLVSVSENLSLGNNFIRNLSFKAWETGKEVGEFHKDNVSINEIRNSRIYR